MLHQLQAALRSGQWREANEITRGAFGRSLPGEDVIRAVDSLWVEASQGRFGFSTQAAIAKGLGLRLANFAAQIPPMVPLGRELGWYQGRGWCCWADTEYWPSLGFVCTIAIPVDVGAVPAGMLPFHDVMCADRWQQGFLPRDCWGEAVWRSWAKVWQVFGLE